MPIVPAPIQQTQIVTPANPPSGSMRLYPKADGNFYKLDSAGVEVAIGGGGGLTLPLSQALTFSPDNTYDIGAAGASRPRTVYAATSVQTLVVESPSGFQNLALKPTNNLQFYTGGTWRWGMDSSALYPAFDNTLDIGISGFRPKKIWARDLESNGVVTVQDLGFNTPSLKNSGMTAFAGRVNFGSTGGSDPITYFAVNPGVPSTAIMTGSTQYEWLIEYWANSLGTVRVEAFNVGVLGSASGTTEVTTFHCKAPSRQAGGVITYAKAFLIDDVSSGATENICLDIGSGSGASTLNLSMRVKGAIWSKSWIEFGTAGSNHPYIWAIPSSLTSLSIEAAAGYQFLCSRDASHVTGNAHWDGAQWLRYDVASSATAIIASHANALLLSPAGANPIPWAQQMSISTTGNMSLSGTITIAAHHL
jgi:hypothetical protein